MATQQDVRRIALSLPKTSEATDHFRFGVFSKGKPKGIDPKKPRVPNPEVLAVRVASLAEKEELLAAVRRSSSPSGTTTASPRCLSGSRPSVSASSRS